MDTYRYRGWIMVGRFIFFCSRMKEYGHLKDSHLLVQTRICRRLAPLDKTLNSALTNTTKMWLLSFYPAALMNSKVDYTRCTFPRI